MNAKQQVKISKFLSLVLRHKPDAAGVVLDDNGWVDVDVLLAGMERSGKAITRDLLDLVVAENDKKRFAFNEDGKRIRASQGHSVEVELAYARKDPPDLLYHGTPDRFLDIILREGLRKMNRHHVHLSADPETAHTVGARRGKPVVLTIAAGRMQQDGVVFYQSANGVWLCDAVPPAYLVVQVEGDKT